MGIAQYSKLIKFSKLNVGQSFAVVYVLDDYEIYTKIQPGTLGFNARQMLPDQNVYKQFNDNDEIYASER